MKALFSTLLLVAAAPSFPAVGTEPLRAEPGPLVHCQVPCGIYGDQMRIDMLMEDTATIDKAMKQLVERGPQSPPNYNQIVRWVTTKDDHAQNIQQTALDYWLAQRIKAPAEGADAAAAKKYQEQLALLHGVIVAAMMCKQTTDGANVEEVRRKALAFSDTYFSEEDLKHIREHHAGGGK